MNGIKIAIVDDQALVRAGLAAIVSAEPDMVLVSTAGRGDDAVKMVARMLPDVVLMDVRLPGFDGIEAVRRICADPLLGDVRVIVLTTFGLDEYVFGALRAGARGFLVKDTPPERLLDAIRQVNGGAVALGEGLVSRLVDEFVRVSPASRPMHRPQLTSREADVLSLVAAGLTNPQIADRLRIGEATVKTYVSRLFATFDVDSRVALAVAAIGTGLAEPSR